MAYRYDKSTGDLVFYGFDKGIANSPHKGIANMQSVNISTEQEEVMCAFNRVKETQSAGGSGTLTVTSASTVSFSGTTPLPGSWIHIVTDSGTGLSGDYYYMGNGMLSSRYTRNVADAISTLGYTEVFLTSGTSYSVPAGWSSASNTIETIAGGGGSAYIASTNTSGGGGGGAYAKISNLTLTPSSSVAYAIGAAGSGGNSGSTPGTNGGDTYFNGANLAGSSVGAEGGKGSTTTTGASGGLASNSVGTTKYNGGNGGNAGAAGGGNPGGSGGGGGAAGPNGAGANGTAGTAGSGGGGGTGGTGGQGGNGNGGAGGTPDGNNGGDGTEWTSKGSGGGGGGVGGSTSNTGGTGGLYGGGAGGTAVGINGGDGNAGLIRITFNDLTATATYTILAIDKPIMSATEPYRDSSNTQQYRYYVLDNAGYIWVHDTATPTSLPNPAWARIQQTYSIGSRIPSGLLVLNGWISYTLDQLIYWNKTVTLGSDFTAISSIELTTNKIHSTLVGHQGKAYWTDGNYIASLFPSTSLLTGAGNIQSYCSYTASSTTGTIASLIGGSYPAIDGTIRVPAVFFPAQGGTKPDSITVGTIYYIKWLYSSNTFEVYDAASGGSAKDLQTGAVGTQYFNTFYPTSSGGLATLTYTAQRLNLPFFETAQCLEELGNTVIIGGSSNTLYPWDQVAALPGDVIPLPEGNVVDLQTVNNMCYVFAGSKGNIYITNGSSASLALSVPDYCAGIAGTPSSYIEPYFTWGGSMFLRGRVYFSILDQTAAKTGNCGGIWSFVPTQNMFVGQDTGQALRLENRSSYGSYNGVSLVLLASQTQTAIGPQYWSGWYSSISAPTYGIDFSDTIPTTPAVIETDLVPTGTLLGQQKQTQNNIEYKLATPLASGETVSIAYRLNASDAYVDCGTFITESATGLSGYIPVPFQNTQWLQLRITLTPLASSSSSFCRLKEVRVRL